MSTQAGQALIGGVFYLFLGLCSLNGDPDLFILVLRIVDQWTFRTLVGLNILFVSILVEEYG